MQPKADFSKVNKVVTELVELASKQPRLTFHAYDVPPGELAAALKYLTRDQLRAIAKQVGVPQGKSKYLAIRNICGAAAKFDVTISVSSRTSGKPLP